MSEHQTVLEWAYHWERTTPDRVYPYCPETRRRLIPPQSHLIWELVLSSAARQSVVMMVSMLDSLVVMLACALNERMQKRLDYVQGEIRVLKEIV